MKYLGLQCLFLIPFISVKYIYDISLKKTLIEGSEYFPICLLSYIVIYLIKLFKKIK